MAEALLETRKTRFVFLSDTHNAVSPGSFKLPKGDVLIHAGDLTNQGSFNELQKAVKWIEMADFEVKIVIAGNHDITLDSRFYDQHGLYFHNQHPQDTAKCQGLFKNSASITYLEHEAVVVNLSHPNGPRTTFKIFGSPYSPAKGMWAYGYTAEEASHIWDDIPLDSDIVVTHTPPKYHCDEWKDRRSAGCEALRCMLWRVRPRLAICGHIHEGRGAEVVRWDLGMSNIKYKEEHVTRWTDPGKDDKKLSIVDLTTKGSTPLDNDGSLGDAIITSEGLGSVQTRQRPLSFTNPIAFEGPSMINVNSKHKLRNDPSSVTADLLDIPTSSLPPATRGQGGIPPSPRCDLEALSGRMGRRETCIINAAITASSWPHKGNGGKKFNKPIVVDIELPVRVQE